VRLSVAPADGAPHVDALVDVLVAALAGVVDREDQEGGFLRFALDVQPDGVALGLTITGPSAPHPRSPS
jgi:hypothetical protein